MISSLEVHGRTHPVRCFKVIAEVVGIAVFAVYCLLCNVLPKIPGLAGTVLYTGKVGFVGLVAVAGSIGAAAVGNEYQVILGQADFFFFAVLEVNNLLGNFLVTYVLMMTFSHPFRIRCEHRVLPDILPEEESCFQTGCIW